jgi:segregation and condensation protein B
MPSVGFLIITLYLAENSTLKDKRRVVKSTLARVRARFNASCSEVAAQNDRDQAILGFSVCGPDGRILRSVLNRIVNFVEDNADAELGDYEIFCPVSSEDLNEPGLFSEDDIYEDDNDPIKTYLNERGDLSTGPKLHNFKDFLGGMSWDDFLRGLLHGKGALSDDELASFVDRRPLTPADYGDDEGEEEIDEKKFAGYIYSDKDGEDEEGEGEDEEEEEDWEAEDEDRDDEEDEEDEDDDWEVEDDLEEGDYDEEDDEDEEGEDEEDDEGEDEDEDAGDKTGSEAGRDDGGDDDAPRPGVIKFRPGPKRHGR